jgi:hypothetical protein
VIGADSADADKVKPLSHSRWRRVNLRVCRNLVVSATKPSKQRCERDAFGIQCS